MYNNIERAVLKMTLQNLLNSENITKLLLNQALSKIFHQNI